MLACASLPDVTLSRTLEFEEDILSGAAVSQDTIVEGLTDSQDETYLSSGSDMDISVSDFPYNSSSESSDIGSDENISGEEDTTTNNRPVTSPLYVLPPSEKCFTAPLSLMDHITAVSGFACRHNLSDTAIKDILDLIALHLPPNNIIQFDINNLKALCGFEDSYLKFYKFCKECGNTFSDRVDNCETPRCTGQRNESKNNQYFATGNLEIQLKEVLSREGIWEGIQETTCQSHKPVTITDIIDGSEYQKLKGQGQFLSYKSNITLTLFTDGVSLFTSSGVSLWPVYFLINEIPRHERFSRKNMILWGLWQGSGKPNMTIFLKPLVLDLQKLYREGIKLKESITCRALLVVATMDLQARASVLYMTQHNGAYSCVYCLESGEVVKSGKGHCRSFPYRENPATLRTDEGIKRDAKAAQETQRKINGFAGDSVFNYLPHFSLCNNVAIDYMHGTLLGITKKLLHLWFDVTSFGKAYYIGKKVQEVDNMLKKITPPYSIHRLPRKLSNTMIHWKASELRSWLLYYSLPCLQGILPDIYLTHFSLLVESTYILLGEGICEQDLLRADKLLCTFVKCAGRLYGPNFLGLNVHNLPHLVPMVRKWGPIWAWSCFCFESFNGEITKTIHGTGNVCRQIFWTLHAQKRIETISNLEGGHLGNFLKGITEGSTSQGKGKGIPAYQCVVIGKRDVDEILEREVRIQLLKFTNCDDVQEFFKASKIIRGNCVFYSKACTKVRKRNSYTARTNDGSIVEINSFLGHKHTLRVFAVCQKFDVQQQVLHSRTPHLMFGKYER